MIGRIVVQDVEPVVECGRWPLKAVVGERFTVTATVFREGHDLIGAGVRLVGPGEEGVPLVPCAVLLDQSGDLRADRGRLTVMRPATDVIDGWQAAVAVDRPGLWTFQVEGWADPVATWKHNVEVKLAAGVDVEVDLQEGALLLAAAAREAPATRRPILEEAARALSGSGTAAERFAAAATPLVADVLAEHPYRELVTASPAWQIWVDRPRALYGSWYEFFPRSIGATETTSGTLRRAADHLEYVAALGFDVVYLPPIHPIGHAARKGPNNALHAGPQDPGSPWAIGSEVGGHDAIHPDLGTIDDFDSLVLRAMDLGLEVALDFALQCSPDHPWVREHPEWFRHRPDGSIAYAENPPKIYQDIVPLDFDGPHAEEQYQAIQQVLEYWIDHGVRIFRVDNPHTKPLQLWERLIWTLKSRYPDVLFLAEAFTRPTMMHALAKLGFTQSYTYFTWRTSKPELEAYVSELSTAPSADFFRPNFWVNTPDILHGYLQTGGEAAFKIRAVLAATLAPSWGVYSGYEFLEAVPVRYGSEEYLDSEKYQYRPRDFSAPPLAGYLRRLNQIRREHRALHWLRNVHIHLVDDPAVLAYSKREGDDAVLVIVNLDPHSFRATTVRLWMPALGLDWDAAFEVEDEITGARWRWQGAANYVELGLGREPAHLLRVIGAGRS